MTPRCSYPITGRRTCNAALTGIYRYCPEHMQIQLANPMGELTEKQRENAKEHAARAGELADAAGWEE